MIASIVFKIKPEQDVWLPSTLGRALHGAFFATLSRINPEIANSLHSQPNNSSPSKFTISPIYGKLAPKDNLNFFASQNEYWFRVTSLDYSLTHCLAKLAPLEIGVINLLGAHFETISVIADSNEHPWAATSDFLEIYEKWFVKHENPPSSLGIEFLTPTTFRRGRINVPFPIPRLVFLTLSQKWNSLSPINLSYDINETIDIELELKRYELRTKMLDLNNFREAGFVGRCEYGIRNTRENHDSMLLRTINLLTDFAFFAGIGAKTSMGMGQVKRYIPKSLKPRFVDKARKDPLKL